MAVLTHNDQYPCLFDLSLLEWERYAAGTKVLNERMVDLGEPYTLWVKYRMRLQIGDSLIYESQMDTTIILEDIRRLIEGLKQLARGKRSRVGFDPMEPDFGLVIRNLTESDTTVMVSSAAEIRAEVPTNAANQGLGTSFNN